MLTGPQLSSLPFCLDGEPTSTDGGATQKAVLVMVENDFLLDSDGRRLPFLAFVLGFSHIHPRDLLGFVGWRDSMALEIQLGSQNVADV
ncbi:hypothetical protein AGABI2DRAFT_119781 [Agaricus bisporus var. bisporus H97]|uniref:hypothetical protein n=1 Tax=Agaricus bisporus var. bisporus (strain H97 / ATCC MYA-4626 / FGSC 10389) TaxID=936046 RepID=UPI00029F748F|nr:hypothetical protein AGABI2DRAFT_119781 [Agaricus bisporus var. bisporus H97]EKV46129.1 hypothetical protein AGABI2DRAFT_119781 [Agaricus bisporus var. bisporus H97]